MVCPISVFLQFRSSTIFFVVVRGCFAYLFSDLGLGTCGVGIEDTSTREAGVPVVVGFLEDSVENFEHTRACVGTMIL